MRLGPIEIVRAARNDALPKAHIEQLGASGTINLDGYLQDDEYNSDLVGNEGLKTFKRMLRSDASVREAYLHCVVPILNAEWDVEPASDEPEHLEHAEFGRRALFEWPVDPFQQTLTTVMKYLPQGFQLFEMVEQVIDAQLVWTDPDTGEPVTGEARQFVCWRRWAHRMPETVWRWNAHGGELESVQQVVFKDGDYVWPVIPASDLALFTNEREGDDWTGQSIFRSAYFAWSLKQMVEKVAGISIERHGVGVNVGYIPESLKSDQAVVDRVEEMLKDLSAGERPYLVFPGRKQGAGPDGGEGYLFEIVAPTGGLPDFVPLLQYLRGEIKGAVVSRFSELGHGQTGARSTGETQSQVWYDALHAAADHVCAVYTDRLAQLIDKNYPGVEEHPKVVARDIEAKSLSEYADAVSKLALSGLVVADKSARAAARKSADIPDEDEGDHALQQELMNPLVNTPGAPGSNGSPPPLPGQKAAPVESE